MSCNLQSIVGLEITILTGQFASLSFNDQTYTTDRVKCSSNPYWNQNVNFLLNRLAKSSTLTVSCWDRDSYGNTYLGEARINLIDIFNNAVNSPEPATYNSGRAVVKIDPKWLKLYSSRSQHTYVTGTIQLAFQLYGKRQKRRLKSILNKTKNRSDITVESNSNINNSSTALADMKKPESPIILTSGGSPASSTNNSPPPPASSSSVTSPQMSTFSVNSVKDDETIPVPELAVKWNNWIANLTYKETPKPDEQGFYSNENDPYSINRTYDVDYSIDTLPDNSHSDLNSSSSTAPRLKLSRIPNSGSAALKTDASDFSDLTDASSIGSAFSCESSENVVGLGIDKQQPNKHLQLPEQKKTSGRRKLRLRRGHKSPPKSTGSYEFSSHSEVNGVLFLEIISASGLPPYKNFMHTGFDMDPFVVVSFGKRTFRTSWRKHTLSPIFNERLAFEVMNNEVKYDIQFCILDKDNFTFHDRVADIIIPVSDIIAMSTNFLTPGENESTESISLAPSEESSKKKALRSGLLRKKIKPQRVLSAEQEEKFIKFDLPLTLFNTDKYGDKYQPILKIKARYEPYAELRQQLWKHLLKAYDMNDDNMFSYLELSAFLDLLGSTLSHQTIIQFFEKYNKNIDNDSLTVDEVIDCLEELIAKKQDLIKASKEGKDTSSSPLNAFGDIIKIDYCPVCGNSRLSKKDDLDIITHVAICTSKDLSSVERLIKSTYVSPSYATKRWYSKVFIKLGYGKVALGSNNANILVQDRETGIILEEKMSVYVRLGIRILYRGSSAIQRKQAKKLLKKLTIKQGKYFDSPKSAKDIASFVKFHKLDLNECLLPIEKYTTFNEFFYRKLVPGARPVEAADNENIICSAADCRCTTFNSVTAATNIWIKGDGFTIPKLFAGKHPQYMKLFEKQCSVAIFRLAPQDYHRFHSPVDGVVGEPEFIDGEYYTVNPMAIRSHLDVFGENIRCIIPIETKPFGTVIVIPVGAMMVGSTVLTVKKGDLVKRGEELGYFKFGGSTLLVLFQQNQILFDTDLVSNSNSAVETLVKVGMSIGHKIDEQELAREKRDFDNEPEHVKLRIIRTITGGGGALADASLGDIKSLSWEASNLKIGPKDWADQSIKS